MFFQIAEAAKNLNDVLEGMTREEVVEYLPNCPGDYNDRNGFTPFSSAWEKVLEKREENPKIKLPSAIQKEVEKIFSKIFENESQWKVYEMKKSFLGVVEVGGEPQAREGFLSEDEKEVLTTLFKKMADVGYIHTTIEDIRDLRKKYSGVEEGVSIRPIIKTGDIPKEYLGGDEDDNRKDSHYVLKFNDDINEYIINSLKEKLDTAEFDFVRVEQPRKHYLEVFFK